MSDTETYEQLRRLKNTVMGAGHRLSLLTRSGRLAGSEAEALAAIAADLAAAAQRLERLLAGHRNRG
jgi:hypothetical protein